jgi:hypothetical protein
VVEISEEGQSALKDRGESRQRRDPRAMDGGMAVTEVEESKIRW